MSSIDWNEIIKYAIAMALAGGLTGGGAMVDRSSLQDSFEAKVESLAKIVTLHANECRD